jgi:hypothetical protein
VFSDVEAFREMSRKWLAEAKHPRWDRLYTELVYQPMIEVLNYLRSNGYRTFIATGGSGGFVREYAEKVYGIVPEQVAGSEQAFKYGYNKEHRPILTREPKLLLGNLEARKIENFWLMYAAGHTRPSATPLPTTRRCWNMRTGGRRREAFGRGVLHDDAKREYAYGLAQGLRVGRHFQSGDVRHGQEARVDRCQHEGRLEAHLRVRVAPCVAQLPAR